MHREMNQHSFFPVDLESKVVCGVDIDYGGDSSVVINVERLRLPMNPELPGAIDNKRLSRRLRRRVRRPRGIVVFELRTASGHVIAHL
jgi:hypothetical protein